MFIDEDVLEQERIHIDSEIRNRNPVNIESVSLQNSSNLGSSIVTRDCPEEDPMAPGIPITFSYIVNNTSNQNVSNIDCSLCKIFFNWIKKSSFFH